MALDKIISKINTESQAECEALLKAARAEASAFLNKEGEELNKKQAAELAAGRKEAARFKQRLLQSAQLSARKEMLSAKQELLGEVFAKALDKIKNLSDDKYRGVIKSMLRLAPLSGDERIIVSNDDLKRLGNEFIAQINMDMKEKGKKNQLTLESDDNLPSGGFISRSGQIESNNSFAGILRARRDELELKVAKILFE